MTDLGYLTLDLVQPGWFVTLEVFYFQMWYKTCFHLWRALLSSEPPSNSSFLLTRRDASASAGSSKGAWSLECGCGSPAVGGETVTPWSWHSLVISTKLLKRLNLTILSRLRSSLSVVASFRSRFFLRTDFPCRNLETELWKQPALNALSFCFFPSLCRVSMMVFCTNVRSEVVTIVGEWCNTNRSNILIYRHCVNIESQIYSNFMRRVNWAQLRIIHSFYIIILNEGKHNAHDMAQNDCTKFQKYWSAFPWAIANKSNILILWNAQSSSAVMLSFPGDVPDFISFNVVSTLDSSISLPDIIVFVFLEVKHVIWVIEQISNVFGLSV